MKIHMLMNTAGIIDYLGHHTLKTPINFWLRTNLCYTGPDRSMVVMDESARPLECIHFVNDEWVIFHFNHDDMAYRFLEEFCNFNPIFKHQVKHRVRTEASNTLNDIYCSIAGELMWLASRGICDGMDFHWTITQLSHEDFNEDIRDTEILFSFLDLQTALMFKLTFGGARCSVR